MPQKYLSFHKCQSLVSCVQHGDRPNVTEVVALSVLHHLYPKTFKHGKGPTQYD